MKNSYQSIYKESSVEDLVIITLVDKDVLQIEAVAAARKELHSQGNWSRFLGGYGHA
ncbi:MAG: hypothetical protein JEZ02_13815 [Desulfatibacillum sp.]|nr:hypothetical protein [Desulfatibacillum sp.]